MCNTSSERSQLEKLFFLFFLLVKKIHHSIISGNERAKLLHSTAFASAPSAGCSGAENLGQKRFHIRAQASPHHTANMSGLVLGSIEYDFLQESTHFAACSRPKRVWDLRKKLGLTSPDLELFLSPPRTAGRRAETRERTRRLERGAASSPAGLARRATYVC